MSCSRRSGSTWRYGRIVDDCAAVAVIRKRKVGERVGSAEVQFRAITAAVCHCQNAVSIAFMNCVVIDTLKVDLIGAR